MPCGATPRRSATRFELNEGSKRSRGRARAGGLRGRPGRADFPPHGGLRMTVSEKISADYTLGPSELSEVLALLVEARQPTIV